MASDIVRLWHAVLKRSVQITVGQHNYFTTSITVLYKLPLVAVLSITADNPGTEKYWKVVKLTHCEIVKMLKLVLLAQ